MPSQRGERLEWSEIVGDTWGLPTSRNKVGAMTKRAGKPGCKFDELLVLEDRQGTNKSTALQVLAIQEDWCGDDLPLTSSGNRLSNKSAASGLWRWRGCRACAARKCSMSSHVEQAIQPWAYGLRSSDQ